MKTKSIRATADDIIKVLETLSREDRRKPIRLELGFSDNRVLPFNLHDVWCETDDDEIVLKAQ